MTNEEAANDIWAAVLASARTSSLPPIDLAREPLRVAVTIDQLSRQSSATTPSESQNRE